MSCSESMQGVGPSRRKFSRCIFFAFFLLLTLCYACGPAYADNITRQLRANLFVAEKANVSTIQGDVNNKEVKCFFSPFLVAADDVMVAFATVNYNGNGNNNVDIMARYIGTEGTNWAEKVTEGNGKNWKTQLLMQKREGVDFISQLKQPVAVVKGKKIYLLAVNYKKVRNNSNNWTSPDWDFELAVGEIKPTGGVQKGKSIEWKIPPLPLFNLTQQFKIMSLRVLPYGGTAFLTRDGRIMFVVRARKQNDDVSAIIHMNDTGEETKWEILNLETSERSYVFSFFEWENKLFRIGYCRNGDHKVQSSADAGRVWTDSVLTVFRMCDKLKGKREFTTATIENRSVLLFSQLKISERGIGTHHEIHLWLTDTNRVFGAGSIFVDNDYVIPHTLLYTRGELFALHQKWNKKSNIFLTRLDKQLEKIKSVLRTWAEKDKYLSRPCSETVPQGNSLETVCITPVPTDGLVGFLSNTTDGDIWFDEYLYANATVKRGTKVDSGFKFTGAGSGAQWSVGEQDLDQRYNFAEYGLTVVATVTIHELPRGDDSPLLVFGGALAMERLGLWYGNNSQWKIKLNGAGTPVGNWVLNKTYRVALMLHNKYASVYVDGKLVGNPLRVSSHEQSLFNIQHLFIGDYEDNRAKDTVNHVTVTNVFLYNRPLNHADLEVLGRRLKDSANS